MTFNTIAWVALCGVQLAIQPVTAIELDLNSQASIRAAAKTLAQDMVNWYTGGQRGQVVSGIPGLLPGPYYWWEAGAMFGTLVDYWYYTGDDQYNDIVMQAMQFQVGPDENFMPPNQSKSLGNDDQAFWGIAAMSAAEVAFPNPPAEQPQWLALAQAVFNSQTIRWDTGSCGGGLRWQIFPFNNGYGYKNSISNGCFFNLAARLGAYTHNKTYLEWAEKAWDWTESVGLINEDCQVFDGTDDASNCTIINHVQWSYNAAVFLLGSAVMWNQTEGAQQSMWEGRITKILDAAEVFFKNSVMIEAACEPRGTCNTDQLSFKAYLSRWMAATTKVASWTSDRIMPLLQASATGAALSCSGGDDGLTCGTQWTTGSWDGTYGVGQQMSAMEVIQSNLINDVPGPASEGNGAISKGDPSAGTGGDELVLMKPVTGADRAGAGVLTLVVLLMFLGGALWMLI